MVSIQTKQKADDEWRKEAKEVNKEVNEPSRHDALETFTFVHGV